MNTEQTVTKHSDSYEFGFIIGVKDAKVEGVIPDAELTALAGISYDFASRSIKMDKAEFIAGYRAGYTDYLNCIV